MKKIFLRILFVIISITISQLLCYFFMDDVFVNFATATQSFLCLRLLIAGLIYISINWVVKNSIYKLEKDIVFLIYIFLSICLSLFRFKLAFYRPWNFNITDIINYSKTTIFFNIIFYIPFGCYLGNRLKINTLYSSIVFLFYIVIIEISQHYLNVGFFDISDIILNYLGFLIGYITQKTIVSFLNTKKLST